MTHDARHTRVAELFVGLTELPAGERDAFLERHCAGDADLREELVSLLACDDVAAEVLGITGGAGPLETARLRAQMPQTVGPYTIIDALGEGGSAIVYLAKQQRPVERIVALKMIKIGMDTREVLARFDTERQALAGMDHPGIARVFDGGDADNGRPYFVMEWVQGRPIDQYCDVHRLSVRERVAQIVKVCRAVQYAHGKGVIHRDLKPSNVLVDEDNERADVKIIDFGIAKAIETPPDQGSPTTRAGYWLGTPRYMSPEQSSPGASDIDTRADIYALGVILYELLTGTVPSHLEGVERQDIARGIEHRNAEKPSARYRALGPAGADIARRRNTSPAALRRQLRGDLDVIAQKAMAVNRDARYASADAMAADLQRFLDNQPIAARAPSFGYVLRRFARRHRAAVAAFGAAFAAIIVGSVALYVGLQQAVAARQEAIEAQVSATQSARDATREAETARRVKDFLVDLFRGVDPRVARGATLDARQLLDRGAASLKDELGAEPRLRAELLDTIGVVYMQLGLYDAAGPLLEQALTLREDSVGAEHPEAAVSRRSLGLLKYHQGRFEEAQALHRQALAINETALGPDTPEVATNLHNIASALNQAGEWSEAETLFLDALERRRRLLGAGHEDVAQTLNNLGGAVRRQGRHAEALAHYEQALTIRQALGQNQHPDTATVLNNLGVTHNSLRQFAAGERYHREALVAQREILPVDHPAILATLNNLAAILVQQDKYTEAEPLFRESVAGHRRAWGMTHVNTAHTLSNYGVLLARQGQLDKGAGALREALWVYTASVGAEHPNAAIAQLNLGNTLLEARQIDAAADLIEKGNATLSTKLPDSHPWRVIGSTLTGAVLLEQQQFAAAEALLLPGFKTLQDAFGPDAPRVRQTARRLVALYEAWGRESDAERYRAPPGSDRSDHRAL